MSTLHLTRGLQASGKTTFAREWVDEDPALRLRVNRDDVRSMVHTKYRNRETEEAASLVQHAAVRNALRRGQDVIVDDTNLNAGIVKNWLKIADQTGSGVEFHDFPIDVEEAVRRNELRTAGKVPEHVIRATYLRYLAQHAAKGNFIPQPVLSVRPTFEQYVPREGTERAVIVDIDGTVALNTGGRSPYDYSRVHEDTANLPVIEMVELLSASGHTIIFMSGRDASCHLATVTWLYQVAGLRHEEDYFGPFMRADGDKRDDGIVKLELFDKYVRDFFNVRFVLDDRNRMVAAWRSIGLPTLQVADGDF